MQTDITSPAAGAVETELVLGEDWFDPLEAGVRTRIRSFIEALLEAELEAALSRKRYARRGTPKTGSGADEAQSRADVSPCHRSVWWRVGSVCDSRSLM